MTSQTRWYGMPPAGRLFLAGTFASNIGNGMQTLAAGALLYQETGTLAAFGIVVVLEQAVTVLMQAVAGPVVDRGDPRRAALWAEVIRGGCVCALSLALAADPGNALLWIAAMTIAIRVAHTFHRAGTFALTPSLVPMSGLARLNSWFSACQQGGQLIGLGATGFVMARWGAPAAFLVNGVTFLISASTLAAISSAPDTQRCELGNTKRPTSSSVHAGWVEFGQLARRITRLAGLIIVSTADNVSLILFNLMLAPVVASRFANDPIWLSLLAGGFAAGALVASGAAVWISDRVGSGNAVLLGITGQMLCFASLWGFDHPILMATAASVLGACNTISWTLALTAVQLAAPASMRGRVAMARNALTAMIVAPLVPLAAGISRTFDDAAPLLLASLVCALFLAIAAVVNGRPDGRILTATELTNAR